MINIQPISPETNITIKLNGLVPKLTTNLEKEIERLWIAEQTKRGKEIFNGQIMSANTVSIKEIHGYIAEYRYLIAQRAKPELFEELQIRPVAISGLFECADGFVFGRRAKSVTQDAGLWELVPSGGIDTSMINNKNSNAKIDYIKQILTELRQEIGITSDFVSNIRSFCLVEDTNSHVLDIGIAMQSPLSGPQILEYHKNNATKEYDKLYISPTNEINNFIQCKNSQLIEVSKNLIQLYYEQYNY